MRFVPLFLLAVAALAQPIAITHVNIVDVVNGGVHPDQTVIVESGKIASISPAANVKLTPNATVINASGEFLIPGLWDMHVHLRSDLRRPQTRLISENEAMLNLFLPNGVVGIAEMGGDLADHVILWREEIRTGKRDGPRIITAGRKLDNDPPSWPGSIGIKTAEDARDAVRENQAAGADFIKIYFRNASPAILGAVVDEAHKLHLKVTGHKPGNMSIQEFVESGVDGMQHAEPLAAANREQVDGLTRERNKRAGTPFAMDQTEFMARFYAMRDAAEGARLYQSMAQKQFWVTPTVAIYTHTLEHGVKDYDNDERRRFFAPALWRTWDPKVTDVARRPFEGNALALRKATTKISEESAVAAFKAGVPMALGTDCGADNDHMMPGWAVHEEMEKLVQIGLTPIDVLRMATINAAKWRGDANEGSVETGKVADLVLLRSNPLSDIRHAKEVDGVFQMGRYYPREKLEGMLGRAAERARSQSGSAK
jgi:imidazolonepropionase-like amidohydrolase